jgi:hypothetical protein
MNHYNIVDLKFVSELSKYVSEFGENYYESKRIIEKISHGTDQKTLENYLNTHLEQPFRGLLRNMYELRSKPLSSLLNFSTINKKTISPYNENVKTRDGKNHTIKSFIVKKNKRAISFIDLIFDEKNIPSMLRKLRTNGTHHFTCINFEVMITINFTRIIIILKSMGEIISNDFETDIDSLYSYITNLQKQFLKIIWIPDLRHAKQFLDNIISFDINGNISYSCSINILDRIEDKTCNKYIIKIPKNKYVMSISNFKKCLGNNNIDNNSFFDISNVNFNLIKRNKTNMKLDIEEEKKAKMLIKNFLNLNQNKN